MNCKHCGRVTDGSTWCQVRKDKLACEPVELEGDGDLVKRVDDYVHMLRSFELRMRNFEDSPDSERLQETRDSVNRLSDSIVSLEGRMPVWDIGMEYHKMSERVEALIIRMANLENRPNFNGGRMGRIEDELKKLDAQVEDLDYNADSMRARLIELEGKSAVPVPPPQTESERMLEILQMVVDDDLHDANPCGCCAAADFLEAREGE